MPVYENRGGDSAVVSHESTSDSITVTFHDGSTYAYDYTATGRHDTEQMKSLARNGEGLNTYISRYVRKRYARKL